MPPPAQAHPPKGALGTPTTTAAEDKSGNTKSTYWELEVELPPETEEVWGAFCYDKGALGAEEIQASPTSQTFRYFFDASPPGEGQDWITEFSAQYPQVAPPFQAVLRQQNTQNWETAWRVHFEPLPIGERLLICPPWDAPESPDALETPDAPESPDAQEARDGQSGRLRVIIDPGQGFGTGRHQSTALALLLLESYLGQASPESMVDVGAGSGILSIAACRLGVREIHALDVDEMVLPEIRKNFALNGLPEPAALVHGGPDSLKGSHPLVVANIIAPVLLEYRRSLTGLTAQGGCLILSGILHEERLEVLREYEALGMILAEERQQDAWWGCRLIRQD